MSIRFPIGSFVSVGTKPCVVTGSSTSEDGTPLLTARTKKRLDITMPEAEFQPVMLQPLWLVTALHFTPADDFWDVYTRTAGGLEAVAVWTRNCHWLLIVCDNSSHEYSYHQVRYVHELQEILKK